MFDVCVTIVNTGEKEEIGNCLRSLYAASASSGLNFCVVIVDNASGDNILEFEQKFANLKVIIQEKNEGFGKSHNKAIESVAAKYYFILNPDTSFAAGINFLRKMFDFMEAHPGVGIAGPKTFYPDGSLQCTCLRFPKFMQPLYSRTAWGKSERGQKIVEHYQMKDFSHNKTLPVDWVIGSAMFVRGEAIKAVGKFDDRFWMYAEDSDWCRRMWEGGWYVYYVHDISVIHVYGRTSAKVPGIISAVVKNKYARIHIWSWFKYFWKWAATNKYYR